MFDAADEIKESLTRHQDFLIIARERQIRWADTMPDPEAVQLHLEAADLLRQSIEKYSRLLDRYQKPAG